MPREQAATVVTWLPTQLEDAEDARDFRRGTQFSGDELMYMLLAGVLPVNLLLDQGGRLMIVVGKGNNQRLVPHSMEVRL